MSQILESVTKRLLANIFESSAKNDSWWDSLTNTQKAEYLKQHPNSKFKNRTQKIALAPVPKLNSIHRDGDDFTDEQNRRAKKSAQKEIDDTRTRNEKTKKDNATKVGVNRAINKDKRDSITKTSNILKHAKNIGQTYSADLLKDANKYQKKPKTAETLLIELEKSPNYRRNMLHQISMKLSSRLKDTTLEDRKAIKKHIGHLYDVGSKEQQMEFLKHALKG